MRGRDGDGDGDPPLAVRMYIAVVLVMVVTAIVTPAAAVPGQKLRYANGVSHVHHHMASNH